MVKFIEDKEKYLATQNKISSLIKQLSYVELDPKIHNINYLPEEVVYFLDKEYMIEFEEFKDIPFKDFKLINYGKPAVNIIFNSKHKYFVKKKINELELKVLIHSQRESLELRLDALEIQHTYELKNNLDLGKQKEIKGKFKIIEKGLKDKIALCKDIFENTQLYESTMSNYYKYYTYTFVTFKYLDTTSGLLVSENSHIVKNVIRNDHLFKVKTNIIFVDFKAMQNHQPYQNKKVESFLNSFDHKFEYGVQELFIKKAVEEREIRYIKDWNTFENAFIQFLYDYKDSNRLRSDLWRAGRQVKDGLNNDQEYSAAFNFICQKLITVVAKQFKNMYLQGYFYIGKDDVIAIAQEQNREYLMLLLLETLRQSYQENPLEQARKIINQIS